MNRAVSLGFVLVLLAGCETPERAAIKRLPEDAPALTYQQLVDRAHTQVKAVQEFSFLKQWAEVEQASEALQQTAQLLTKMKPEDVPASRKESFRKLAEEMLQAAVDLQAAAKAKDLAKTDDAFQRLNVKVRELRPD